MKSCVIWSNAGDAMKIANNGRSQSRPLCANSTSTGRCFQSKVAQLDHCYHDPRGCRRILKQMGLPQSEIAIVLRYLGLQGGHCDCEVIYNVDMTKPRPLVSFDRVDCGADFDEFDYMVEDTVWAAGGLEPDGGLLCIGCLERRLGRRVKRDDFKSTPSLEFWPTADDRRSLRLRNRLSRR